MRISDAASPLWIAAFRAWRATSVRIPGGKIRSLGPGPDQIGAIVIINLDRHPDRWHRVKAELRRFRTSKGDRLSALTQRFTAVDARDGRAVAATADVDPEYRIGDQLYVQPDTSLAETFTSDEPVRMTRQEVAVARSHIEVWKMVATGSTEYTLVLEDDIWFRPGAKAKIDRGWREAIRRFANMHRPSLVYFAYQDAGGKAPRVDVSRELFRPERGLWHLAGYVLSREGADALLGAMPVVGPVDLWMNYRFSDLDVLALSRPAIAQRSDIQSSNSYSVMPYLARAGVVDGRRESKPSEPPGSRRVLAWSAATENESLAMALSMLGLRVRVFDGHEPPLDDVQLSELFTTFDALIDPPIAGKLEAALLEDERIAILLDSTTRAPQGLDTTEAQGQRMVVLGDRTEDEDPWGEICAVLGVAKPTESFPVGAPKEVRLFRDDRQQQLHQDQALRVSDNPPMDDSPWILPPPHSWRNPVDLARSPKPNGRPIVEAVMDSPSIEFPSLRETFPGNLSSFAPENLVYTSAGVEAVLEPAKTGPRPFRSGALASSSSFAYGRFQAEIRAAAGPGLVTGFFLHRSAPRQEIDIEFIGSNPRRMLTNIFFNPGDTGAAMDFGYRGSPCWVDLGFDSTQDFHEYAIDWRSDRVTWLVDGQVVHERESWDPTPIPHLGMRLHANLWAPRSQAFAGRINQRALPATAAFRRITVAE